MTLMCGRTVLVTTMTAVCLAATAHAQGPSTFRARLSRVPIDVAALATVAGSGSVIAELTGATLAIRGTFDGLVSPATIVRVHRAPIGIRGKPIFDLTTAKATSGTIAGTIALTRTQVDDLKHGRLYVQLHSEKAPDGNLWGWFLPEGPRR